MGIDPRKQDLRLGVEEEVKGKSVMGYIMKLTPSVPCPLKPPKKVRKYALVHIHWTVLMSFHIQVGSYIKVAVKFPTSVPNSDVPEAWGRK